MNHGNEHTDQATRRFVFRIFRYTAGDHEEPRFDTYELDAEPGTTVLSALFAIQSMTFIGQCLGALSAGKPPDLHIREKLLHASMLAGFVIAQTGTTVVHAMGYCLTYFKDIDHGRANALLIAEYLKYVALKRPDAVNEVLSALDLTDCESFERMIDGLLGPEDFYTHYRRYRE